jgi:hypothetical protein
LRGRSPSRANRQDKRCIGLSSAATNFLSIAAMNPENFERNDELFSPQVVAVSDKLTGERLGECATIQRSLTVVIRECSRIPGPGILSPNKPAGIAAAGESQRGL